MSNSPAAAVSDGTSAVGRIAKVEEGELVARVVGIQYAKRWIAPVVESVYTSSGILSPAFIIVP